MRLRSTLASALALALATSVAAAQGGPPLDEDTFRPTMAMLDSMLDLTDEQVAVIEPWRDTLLVESQAMRHQAVLAHEAFMAAKKGGVSDDSVTVLHNRFRGSMMALMPYRMQFMEHIKPHLTAEQVAIMDQRHEEQMAKMQKEMAEGCKMGQGQGGGGMGQGMGMGQGQSMGMGQGKGCGEGTCPCKGKAASDSGETQP